MVLAVGQLHLRSLCEPRAAAGGCRKRGGGFILKESTYLYALCRLLDRQGRFTGGLNALQLRLLSYLVGREHAEKVQESEMDFKNLVFANDPNLYFKLFEENEIQDDEVDWVIPQTEADVDFMMQQLKEAGVFD